METQELIIVEVFCKDYHVELELIDDLEAFGLITTVVKNTNKYFEINQLIHIEKVIRLHNDLNINKEGIEVVLNLLEKETKLNKEMTYLRAKLSLYE